LGKRSLLGFKNNIIRDTGEVMGSNGEPPLSAATMTSYAQNREDVILNRIFKDVKDGFYIDIGAYHPAVASVTKAFYDRGWSGINVEPGSVFDELERARPRDVNLKAAVVDYDADGSAT
jgi:hypothetical protein